MTTRVLIVDRMEYLAKGVADVLRNNLDIEVVGSVSNYEQILRFCASLAPNVLIIDPDDMQETFYFAILERIRLEHPQINIIIFTNNCSSDIINHALNKIGVKGFVSKNDPLLSSLTESIKHVSQGHVYIDPKLQGQYIKEKLDDDLDDLLTTTQLKIFVKVSEGKSKKDIADEMELTERYVGNVIQELRKKLHARNDVELVHEAVKKGLLEVRDKLLQSSRWRLEDD